MREKSSISFLTFLKEIFILDKNDFIVILILDYVHYNVQAFKWSKNESKVYVAEKPFMETYNVAQSR